jgi:hypothetical protein
MWQYILLLSRISTYVLVLCSLSNFPEYVLLYTFSNLHFISPRSPENSVIYKNMTKCKVGTFLASRVSNLRCGLFFYLHTELISTTWNWNSERNYCAFIYLYRNKVASWPTATKYFTPTKPHASVNTTKVCTLTTYWRASYCSNTSTLSLDQWLRAQKG